jgi:hypothetical protein
MRSQAIEGHAFLRLFIYGINGEIHVLLNGEFKK